MISRWIIRRDYRVGDKFFSKGSVITSEDVRLILSLGQRPPMDTSSWLLSPLEQNDIIESEMLSEASACLLNSGITIVREHRGHVWLAAGRDGWLDYDTAHAHALVAMPHGIATHFLPRMSPVRNGEPIAILKSLHLVYKTRQLALWKKYVPAINLVVRPGLNYRLGLIIVRDDTNTPPGSNIHPDVWVDSTRTRLKRHHHELELWTSTSYEVDKITAALKAHLKAGCKGIIIVGAPSPLLSRDPLQQALVHLGWKQRISGISIRPGNHISCGYFENSLAETTPKKMLPENESNPEQSSPWAICLPRSFRQASIDHAFDIIFPRLLHGEKMYPAILSSYATQGLRMANPNIHKTKGPRNVTGLILAAGYAQRMGFDKRLRPWSPLSASATPRPLILSTIDCLGSVCKDIRLVIRSSDDEMLMLVRDLDVSIVHAPADPIALGASLQAGIASLGRHDELILIVPCDLPRLNRSIVDKVAAALQKNPQCIVRPFFNDQPGHPVGVSRHIARRWRSQLHGESGAHPLFESAKILRLDIDDVGVVCDVDTVDDWNRSAGDIG